MTTFVNTQTGARNPPFRVAGTDDAGLKEQRYGVMLLQRCHPLHIVGLLDRVDALFQHTSPFAGALRI